MSRFGGLIERFNKWLAPAAVSASVEQQQGTAAPSMNAVGVKTVMGEIEQVDPGEREEPAP